MIDSHCHFDLAAFDNIRETTLQNCLSLGLSRMLIPGLDLSQFMRLLDLQKSLAASVPKMTIDIALGLHPYFLKPQATEHYTALAQDFQDYAQAYFNRIVAIGECGLDGSLALPMDDQQKVLAMQIETANAIKKPLVLHHRQSHNQLIKLLKETRFSQGGILHAFSGSLQTAMAYIEMGFVLGIGGTITYERALKTINTVKQLPLDCIVLETDAPDMPLKGFQGEHNTPLRLPLVAQALASIKGLELSEIQHLSTENYYRALGL